MNLIPETQKALKIKSPGQVHLVARSAVPHLEADEIIVRVVFVAVNPVDGKSADQSPTIGATLGCDFSGEVVARGSTVSKSMEIGDRVCGCIFGNNPDRLDNGAFSEYVAVPANLVFKIPSQLSYQAAATLGVGLSTVGMALYHALKLPAPSSPVREPRYVLVYGGGTATGALAIQMLRLSGLSPVTTCSPRTFSMVKALGAVAAFDYRSATCGDEIRELTENTLDCALDCISNTTSMKICYAAIGSQGGKYLSLDPFPIRGHTRRSIKPNWIITLTMFNKPINWKRPFKRDAKPKDREFAEGWFKIAQKLVDDNDIQPFPHQEMAGGLEGIIQGIDSVQKGEVSGIKLVYQIGK